MCVRIGGWGMGLLLMVANTIKQLSTGSVVIPASPTHTHPRFPRAQAFEAGTENKKKKTTTLVQTTSA